jgi:pilus assembly protein CpaF
LVTVHANSAEDALFRLETLATMSDLRIPHAALREYVNAAVHVIVQVERGSDGSRRMTEVACVGSSRGEPFRLDSVVRFEPDPVSPELTVTGETRYSPLPARIAQRLRLSGVTVPDAFRAAESEEATW